MNRCVSRKEIFLLTNQFDRVCWRRTLRQWIMIFESRRLFCGTFCGGRWISVHTHTAMELQCSRSKSFTHFTCKTDVRTGDGGRCSTTWMIGGNDVALMLTSIVVEMFRGCSANVVFHQLEIAVEFFGKGVRRRVWILLGHWKRMDNTSVHVWSFLNQSVETTDERTRSCNTNTENRTYTKDNDGGQ